MHQQLPQASVSICEGLSISMQEWLISGRLDIAVLYNAQPTPEIELSPRLEEVLVQSRPPDFPQDPSSGPVALKDIAQLPLVIPSRPNALRMRVDTEMAHLGLRPTVALEIDGAGVALLSRNAVANSSRPLAFLTRPMAEPPLRNRLSLATSAQRLRTLTQKTCLGLLRSTAPQVLASA